MDFRRASIFSAAWLLVKDALTVLCGIILRPLFAVKARGPTEAGYLTPSFAFVSSIRAWKPFTNFSCSLLSISTASDSVSIWLTHAKVECPLFFPLPQATRRGVLGDRGAGRGAAGVSAEPTTHLCIGKHFALMEIVAVLATLAQRFRFRRLAASTAEPDPLIALRTRDLWVSLQSRELERSGVGETV